MVTIIVGSDIKKHYNIHAGLLKHYSSYFRNGLKEGWKEGATRTFALVDEDPNIFQLFFHWIYSDRLYSTLTKDDKIPVSMADLCALFVFGDARGIPELCNTVIDTMFQKFANEWTYPCSCLTKVYDNTLHGSKLRKIFVDLGLETHDFTEMRKSEDLYPKEYLMDVVLRSREKKIWPGNFSNKERFLKVKATALCFEYHDHGDPHIM